MECAQRSGIARRWAIAASMVTVAPLMQCGETQFGAGSGDGGSPSLESGAREASVHEASAPEASAEAAVDASVRFTMPTVLARGQSQPKGIAVDANYLYWVNAESASGGDGTVQALEKGKTTAVEIVGGQVAPLDIVLDDSALFWSVNTGGTVPGAAQCLTMRLNKLLVLGPQCVTKGLFSTTRLTLTTDQAFLVLIAQGANTNPSLVVTAKTQGSASVSAQVQGPAIAVAANTSSAFVGNMHGPHIDTYPLAPPFNPADPGLCGAQDCAGNAATAGGPLLIQDIAVASDNTVFWVASDGEVLSLSAANAGQTPTTLGMVQGTPQRIALDGSHVYVTSSTAAAAGTITAVSIGGTLPTELATPDCAPFGVAVDTLNVYWTCSDGTVRAVGVPQ